MEQSLEYIKIVTKTMDENTAVLRMSMSELRSTYCKIYGVMPPEKYTAVQIFRNIKMYFDMQGV